MQFRDLPQQYQALKSKIDQTVLQVMEEANFISGRQVNELEEALAEYVGVKHCITCANGTDALSLVMMAWDIGEGDAVFVPDFTFFSTGEIVSFEGATPIFVDVEEDTFNMSPASLEKAIEMVIKENKLIPKVVISVDLFGQPADYTKIIPIVRKYGLKLLEDGAQGFGGMIGNKKACSFGDVSTTSFFPAKPLGCYGDGGAIFTDSLEMANLLKSLTVHGKGDNKYDNIRIGMNSRLDTIQAAILKVKLNAFIEYELSAVNQVAEWYHEVLDGIVKTPIILPEFYSSWAQFTLLLTNQKERDGLQMELQQKKIPSMVYYQKPMHKQIAFKESYLKLVELSVSEDICNRVLSLPLHPYLSKNDVVSICNVIREFIIKLKEK